MTNLTRGKKMQVGSKFYTLDYLSVKDNGELDSLTVKGPYLSKEVAYKSLSEEGKYGYAIREWTFVSNEIVEKKEEESKEVKD